MDSYKKDERMAPISEYAAHIPHASGCYLYRDSSHTVIYVGKAVDLKKRVGQYFSRDNQTSKKTRQLVTHIAGIETIQTATEFDALLLEAKLIRQYQPKYNSIAKDDKSPLYIALTLSETLPRLLFVRGKVIDSHFFSEKDRVFGPFQSGRVAKMMVRSIRRSIPYCIQKIRNGKPCFYAHLGLCDPCPSVIVKLERYTEKQEKTKTYRRNIFRIADILSGKTRHVLKQMQKDMKELSDNEKYENALTTKQHIDLLYALYTRRYDVSLYTDNTQGLESVGRHETAQLGRVLVHVFPEISPLQRIECIDISNTGGAFATGSLVVLTNGIIDPGEYRRFRIKRQRTPNDSAMIAEVLTRRFSHPEWPIPDLLVVDGGKPQVASASDTMSLLHRAIPIIGLAKRREEIIVLKDKKYITLRLPLTNPSLHLLERIRDEAHRFARKYHRHLRQKGSLSHGTSYIRGLTEV